MELNRLSACELAARLQSRSVDAEEVARAHLERIAVREPAIGAWAHLDPEQLLHAARVLDAGPIRGPLHGLPVAVKDISQRPICQPNTARLSTRGIDRLGTRLAWR